MIIHTVNSIDVSSVVIYNAADLILGGLSPVLHIYSTKLGKTVMIVENGSERQRTLKQSLRATPVTHGESKIGPHEQFPEQLPDSVQHALLSCMVSKVISFS